ncbi:MAG TPA: translocation/assembly module TamB domain-containing protein, partial [Steroidobacteraceae bacterium]|nr:translocation/assembly module TamB domain-containing protein [Steroidobacteraceae bacterium]
MRRILLLIAGLLILLSVAVPTAAVYYLAFTESGFRFVIGRVPHRVAGVQLDIVNPSGTIARGIRVERLEIDHHLVHLTIDGIQGRVELLPLLLQTIKTTNASIGSVSIQVKRRTKPPSRNPPFFLPRWLIVSADHAHIGSAVLTTPSGFHLEATGIHATGIARHRRIRFFEAGMRMGNSRLTGTGELQATDPLGMDVQVRIDWNPGDQPAWSVDTSAKGNLKVLAVTGHTVAPFRADFTGQALDLTGHWHWLADTTVHDLDVTTWGGSPVLGLLSGQLAAQGDQDGFSARGPVVSTGLKVGSFDAAFAGAYANHVLTATHMELTHHDTGAHAEGAGTIEVVRNGPRLDLHGTWHEFRWPLIGRDVPFHSASGEYRVSGTWPYSVSLNGMATVRDLPEMPARVEGNLAKDRFTFNSADADLYDGHANVHGVVTWTPLQTWSATGHISDVNPGRLREDLPGKLTFNIAAEARGFEGNDYSVDIRDITGKLRGVAASGGGRIVRTGATWRFDQVRVALGGTNLALDGNLGSNVDLRFAVTSRDLSLLAPESRGQLTGSGTIRGTLKQPSIVATAHGAGIRHEGIAVDEFDANVDYDPDPQHESRIHGRLSNLVYREHRLDALSFKLTGKTADYLIQMEAKALGLSAVARAHGPYINDTWQGELASLTVTGTESLHLELERSVDLQISADRIHAEWMCMVGQPASMCADGEWTPKQWDATFTANEMPLSTFTAGLTPSVEYGGRINVLAHLTGSGSEPAEGNIRAELTDAQLTHRLSSGRIEHTRIGSGSVKVNATHSTVSAEIGLESGEVGTIAGRLDAQRGPDNWQDIPVRGEIHAHTEQLGLITLYIPDIDRAAGHLDTDMKVAGTLGTPLINGDLKISSGEIDYYRVNLAMRQVAFDATLSDNGLDFTGFTRIGSGTADARGHMEWRNSLPYGKVRLEGSNLRVVDIPEAQIDASPTLDFNITGRRIETTGEVKVPYAKIVPRDLSGAVRSSSDEVIVGQEQKDPSKRFEVVSSIMLSLGDRVSIDTTGLTGRLTGNITVRSGYEPTTNATGELSIEQGKYTAYARKLDIQRGRLIFTGGPIDNPGVDLRAVKQFPDVTAGV